MNLEEVKRDHWHTEYQKDCHGCWGIAEVERLEATIEPVRSWYDGDGRYADVGGMLTWAIQDLQTDRKELLRLKAKVERLTAQLQPQEESQEPDEFTKLRQEVEKLKAELEAMRTIDPARNAYLIEAKGSLETNQQLRKTLKDIKTEAEHPDMPRSAVNAVKLFSIKRLVEKALRPLPGVSFKDTKGFPGVLGKLHSDDS